MPKDVGIVEFKLARGDRDYGLEMFARKGKRAL